MESTYFSQLQTWDVHQKINRFILNHIDEDLLMERPSDEEKSVGAHFGHMHTVRLMWLQVSAPDLWDKLQRIDKQRLGSIFYLQQQLKASGKAIHEMLDRSFQSQKVMGFSGTPDLFLGYLIAQESHYRGQILLTLKVNDHAIPLDFEQAIWDWAKMAK
ncbi:MAG: DinB family protein [Bacteroidota bacterium]